MLYDCLIIGGGPAGLSASVYMGRFLRKTLVLDTGRGRSTFEQVNDNYLGFPEGINVRDLRERGKLQAERFGVEFCQTNVDSLHRDGAAFIARTSDGEFKGKTVILCTGVCDVWPDLPNVLEYVGKTLFWCITCDGFRSLGKRVVLFGNDDDAATTACQFKLYTPHLTFVSTPGSFECSDDKCKDMLGHGIEIIEGEAAEIIGTPEKIEAVLMKDGQRLPADLLFSLLGCTPNNKLAQDLDVKLDKNGYVIIDQEGYTSVPGIFCAGDLTKMHTHQVVSAAHAGAEAAQTANYYLYSQYQKI